MDVNWISLFFSLVLFVWTSRTGSSLSAFHGGANFLLVCGSPAVKTFRRTSSRLPFKECAWDKWPFWWTIEPDLCGDPWRAVMRKTPPTSRWAETRSSVVYGEFVPNSHPFLWINRGGWVSPSTSHVCTFIQRDKRMQIWIQNYKRSIRMEIDLQYIMRLWKVEIVSQIVEKRQYRNMVTINHWRASLVYPVIIYWRWNINKNTSSTS